MPDLCFLSESQSTEQFSLVCRDWKRIPSRNVSVAYRVLMICIKKRQHGEDLLPDTTATYDQCNCCMSHRISLLLTYVTKIGSISDDPW